MSHNPPTGPPHYYGYATAPPAGYAYVPVPAQMMMPMYHPPPPHQPPHHPHPHYQPPPPEPTPQPTYVTNYIYQQPPQPEPVTVVEEPPPSSFVLPRPWQALAGIAENCLSEVNKRIANNNQQTTHVFDKQFTPEVIVDWAPATPSSAASLTHRAFVAGKEGWDGSPLWVIRAHHSGEFIPGKLSIKHRAAYIPHGGREVPVHNFEVLCAPQNGLRWLPASNGQVPVGAIAAGNTHNAEPLYIARVRHMRSTTPGKVHPSHGTAYISFGGSEIPYKNYEVLCRVVG